MDQEELNLTLDKLPTEIILHICQFLDARYVADVFSLVCHRFSDLLKDQFAWKSRMITLWSEKYLVLENEEIDWKQSCIDREEEFHFWNDYQNLTNCQTLGEIHISSIDSYKMLQDTSLLAAASRDRSFSIWDMEKLDNETEVLVHHEQNAHEGWIWCILGSKDKFFTGSWDTNIKTWDSNSFTNLDTIKCPSNILCLAQDQWALFAGLYQPKIQRIDLRQPSSTHHSYNFHKRAVLDLKIIKNNHLASISEDGNLNIIDWRMEQVLHCHKFNNYPSRLSYNNNQLWVGDKGGNIHLINPDSFEIVKTFPKLHEKLITGIKNSMGSITTASKDGIIRILEPTLKLKEIARISSSMESTGFERYRNKLITSIKSGCDITIWSSKFN